MLRKCVIAATVLSFTATVAGVLMWIFYWPKVQGQNAALIALVVERAATEFHKEIGEFPGGNCAEVADALLGENSKRKNYLRPEFRNFLDEAGEVMDSWKRPFRADRQESGSVRLRSAGKNGSFDDEDDVTSALANR
jgi:hypothetical protein